MKTFKGFILALSLSAVCGPVEAATLTITTTGTVSGAVGVQPFGNLCNPNPGGGAGGGTCQFNYPAGTPLRIMANSPSTPGIFSDGTFDAADCDTSTCNFVLDRDSSILATFDPALGPFSAIEIGLLGDGKGNLGMDNNQCQNFELGFSACTVHYGLGSEVRFQGRSMPGNIFAGFSAGTGDAEFCGADAFCTFTATGTSSVNVTFSALASVAITPSAATIGVTQNQAFTAVGTFINGMTRESFNGSGHWLPHVPMDVERFSLAAATVSDRLYAIGGVDGSCPSSPCDFSPLGTVEVFNPNVTAYAEFEQAWTPKMSMSTPREGLAAVTVNGKIYAIGGHTLGGGTVDSMEVYDPPTNLWSPGASMSGPRAGMAAAAIDNTIYAVGGTAGAGGGPSTPLHTVEAYDAAGPPGWTTIEPMLTARNGAAAAAVNGVLYVIGGDGVGTVEAYDPAAPSPSWSTKTSMPGGGGSHTAVALNSLIYVVGGPGGTEGTVKVYNPATDSWATVGTVPSVLDQFALAVLDGRLFTAGGMKTDETAAGTLDAFRPPEATWWSSNTAVARINPSNTGDGVNGVSVGEAIISARLVAIASGPQSATLTVNAGGGGGGSTIFVNGPQQAFTQVGNPNWGCGTFSQNAAGPWTVMVHYGELGGVAEPLPFTPDPAPGSPCVGPNSSSKGVFFFSHAYNSPGTFHVTVTVTNTATSATGTDEFDVQVQPHNIFVNGPSQASTQVGNTNWGCGTFSQTNGTGPYTATINYGEPGGVAEPLPFTPPPGPCGGGPSTKGVFFLTHAYSSPGTYHVTISVSTATQSATDEFDVQVQPSGGGGGDGDGCTLVSTNLVAGSVPFNTVQMSLFDRTTGELLFTESVPLGMTELGEAPEGFYRVEFSVPAGYTITPAHIDFDAVCGEAVVLNAQIGLVVEVDTAPPVVSVPASISIVLTTNAANSAVVTFTASASDAVDGATPVICVPASGSTFPVGTTTVSCMSSDHLGNTSQPATFAVIVAPKKAKAPKVHAPANMKVEATGPSGAIVTFTATATDPVYGTLPVTCLPASGSVFPLGATTVLCSATNDFGETDADQAVITVRDKTAPAIVSVTPSVTLLPDTDETVPVTIAVVATDVVDVAPACRITKVGGGQDLDDDGVIDWTITGDLSLSIEANARRHRDRTYRISIQCTDASGNAAAERTAIVVSHNP